MSISRSRSPGSSNKSRRRLIQIKANETPYSVARRAGPLRADGAVARLCALRDAGHTFQDFVDFGLPSAGAGQELRRGIPADQIRLREDDPAVRRSGADGQGPRAPVVPAGGVPGTTAFKSLPFCNDFGAKRRDKMCRRGITKFLGWECAG